MMHRGPNQRSLRGYIWMHIGEHLLDGLRAIEAQFGIAGARLKYWASSLHGWGMRDNCNPSLFCLTTPQSPRALLLLFKSTSCFSTTSILFILFLGLVEIKVHRYKRLWLKVIDLNLGHPQDIAPSCSLTLKLAIIGDNYTRHLLTLYCIGHRKAENTEECGSSLLLFCQHNFIN